MKLCNWNCWFEMLQRIGVDLSPENGFDAGGLDAAGDGGVFGRHGAGGGGGGAEGGAQSGAQRRSALTDAAAAATAGRGHDGVRVHGVVGVAEVGGRGRRVRRRRHDAVRRHGADGRRTAARHQPIGGGAQRQGRAGRRRRARTCSKTSVPTNRFKSFACNVDR